MRGGIAPVLLLALAASACTEDKPSQIGVAELMRVRATDPTQPAPQFFRGTLPGATIVDGGPKGPPTTDSGPYDGPPFIIGNKSASYVLQGQSGAVISGDATTNAYSVGITIEKVSQGYWVFPVGAPDPNPPYGLQFDALADFDRSIPPGNYVWRTVAFDKDGNAGQQAVKSLCIQGASPPDNFHTCYADTDPHHLHTAPAAVISLTWDVPADLDLQVRMPDGHFVDSKHPFVDPIPDSGTVSPKADRIDRDSNANCQIDGINGENLIFWNDKPHGTVGIYANLFDACKQAAVHFNVAVYTSPPEADGGPGNLVKLYETSGILLDISANGGTQRGLFVTDFHFK
jgi:hypothetical protein